MVAGMLMPLRDLRAIYEVLFRDGVMVAKKDKRPQTKHPEIEGVSNLQVIRAMGSLKSRGFVKETFAWRHFYWYLTNEGIVYLREYLHLPPEIVPASLQRVRKPAATLAIAHRAARVQSVDGPTSYVPKPGRRLEAESQEAVAERQGYRHKMMGPGESESFNERTPKFRGRPLAAEPVKTKTSWDVADQRQPMFRKGDGLRSEAAVMEERVIKRAFSQQSGVSGEKVSQFQKEKAAQIQQPESKPNASQMTFASISSKIGPPLGVAAFKDASSVPASFVSSNSSKEEVKTIDNPSFMKSGKIASSNSVITCLLNKDLKEENVKRVAAEPVSQNMIVDPVKVEIKINADKTALALKDTAIAPSVITEDVKEEKLQKEKKMSVKPPATKTSGESKNDKEKVKKIAKVSVSRESTNPPDTTLTEVVLTTDVKKFPVQEPEMTSVMISTKSQSGDVPQKTVVDKSVVKIQSTTTVLPTLAAAEDRGPTNKNTVVTEVITKQEKKVVKAISHVNKNEKNVKEEVVKISLEEPKLDVASAQPSQSPVTTEVVKENKHVVDGTSKSKKKKRKSPGETTGKENLSTEKPPEEVVSESLQINPQATAQTLLDCTSTKTEKTLHVSENKTVVEMVIDGSRIQEASHDKPMTEVPKQTTAPLNSDKFPTVPPVDLPAGAEVRKPAEVTIVGEKANRAVCPGDKLNIRMPGAKPVKSEELAVTTVEKVLVQKITKVQLVEGSPDMEEENPSPLLQSQDSIPARKHSEEPAKSKKKGKAKKQTREPALDAINVKVEAEALPSASLPVATVTDCPVTASELKEVSLPSEMTPEIICSEEAMQAAAALAEAPADKREAEPALPSAEKIKREVPKPETSCAVREAHTATESATPVAATQAAVARASPLAEQEEPPKVAQYSASEAAEHSTGKSLSASEASQTERATKTGVKDTPSTCVTATAACFDQLHLGHTSELIISNTDEAAMRKKIVVVEEIVEVKQIINPQAAEEQPPPAPVKTEEEAEELDLDVLEALAIERALLSGAAGAQVLGASPEDEWDHSLQEPEEKTWPNFIEGLFKSTR